MQALVELLRVLLPAGYALSEVAYLSLFIRDDPVARRVATPLLGTTVILHAVFIGLRGLALEQHPIGSPLEALTIMAFAVALVHLLIELSHGNQSAGAFVIGVVCVFQFISSASMGILSEASRIQEVLRSPLFIVHVGTAIIGYSSFALSATYGLLFLLLYRELKASRFGRIYERLPSLDLLARMTIRAAAVGLALISVAIASGIVWSVQLHYEFLRDPKFLTTILLWIVYGACLGAHHFFGWHERRVVYFSLVGFVIMILSLVTVHILFRAFHNFASGA